MPTTESYYPRITVPSGSYVISEGKQGILEAYLGSCVGVALCDPHANVGGLIHLLLPEPQNIDSPWRPEVYAATGLPIVIQHLCREGARKENLQANIAGGALVGPLSKQDLMLDIGGRTADVVERILHQEKIAIWKSEIGGYFSCRLSLNLHTWDSVIDPIGISTALQAEADFEKPDLRQLDRAITHIRPIPQIALKVIRMISDQDYNAADVAHEVMQDQVLSAKIIGFCNSAFGGLRAGVDSIERALLVVGERWLLHLIVKAALESFLSQKEGGYSLCKGGLFQHSCSTAAVARSLSQFTGNTPPDLAYTAGLLHDIGKAVLDQYVEAVRPLLYRNVQMPGIDLIRAETKLFGISHPEVGGRLARLWAVPETLADAIQYHHQPEQATNGSELTHLIYLADLITSRFMVGQELEKLNTDGFASRMHKAGFRSEQLPFLIDNALREMQNSAWPVACQ
jgi:putative nucleotidyltransferase with HDIG domain